MSETRAHALAISNACSLAVALARDLAFTHGIDVSGAIDASRLIYLFHTAYRYCLSASSELGLSNLSNAITNLPPPYEEDTLETWQAFVSSLRKVMIEYRDIGHEWGLTAKHVEQLRLYNETNILLMECLKVAYVTDRVAIEDNLLLLPDD